jgi:hypothetical protein
MMRRGAISPRREVIETMAYEATSKLTNRRQVWI